MVRPALSAARSVALINLMTANPGRGFTMAEIIRETNINVSSLHSILAVLMDAGYVTKLPRDKRYILGPSLTVSGEAALQSNPLIGPARTAADELFEELGIPVLLSTEVGGDLLSLHSVADRSGRRMALKTGERRPISPIASLFRVAWSSPEVIDAWIEKAGVREEELVVEWHRAVALIRERGFQVTLFETHDEPLHEMVADLANGNSMAEYRNRSMGLIGSRGQRLTQPEVIDPDGRYDVAMIAAPIFDQRETLPLSLALVGFPAPISGEQIQQFATRLVQTCLRVMHAV